MRPVYLPEILHGRLVQGKDGRFRPNWLMRLTQHLRIGRFGVCPCCMAFSKTIERARQSTMYADDTMNWFTGCTDCHEENERYWRERWDEYYSGIGV